LNVLEVARSHGCRVFFPSSIGAFGPLTPPEDTPQDTIQHPTTMYGVTKVSGELLCGYYHMAMSLAPQDIAAEIGRHSPGLTIDYRIDPVRQAIAESWPRHMDDSAARAEWGWDPQYDLSSMAKDMLDQLSRLKGTT